MGEIMEEFISGTNQKILAHSKEDCKGYCPIHNPSDHHMKNWPLHWRQDRGIFERLCEHGVGHPDPDSLAYIRSINSGDDLGLSLHGCDGCCHKPLDKDNNS